MKILYIAMEHRSYSDRGHEIKVAETMANLGHDVHVVCSQKPVWDEKSPQPSGLTVDVQEVNTVGAAGAIASGLPEADVGFASSVSGAPILAAWKKRTKARVVAQVLDVPLWRLQWGGRAEWHGSWKPWHDALYEMDALVANTNQTVRDLEAARALYAEARPTPPTSVVYYGIDVEAADQAPPASISAGAPEGERYPIVASCSRLVPYKGHELMISALATRKKDPVAYYLIGAGEDLWRLAQMDQLLYGGCNFLGGLSDAQKFSVIKASDAGALLAYNPHIPAQFPMESVYCGKACVVADIPINRERFLDHGVHYCDPCDQRSVNDAITYALDEDKGMSAHQEWVLENRSFHSHAKGVLDVLRA